MIARYSFTLHVCGVSYSVKYEMITTENGVANKL